MLDTLRYHTAVPRLEIDHAIAQVNQEVTANDVEELVLSVVLVPMVLALDDTETDNGVVDLAESLVVPRDAAGLDQGGDIDIHEWPVLDIQASVVGKGSWFGHQRARLEAL